MFVKRFFLSLLLACLYNTCADPQQPIHLTILADNVTYTFLLNDLDDVAVPFNITIKGIDLNGSDFWNNYQLTAQDLIVTIDLGLIYHGQKVDVCAYFEGIEIPTCKYILVKPLPTR